jgi:hypothetical protein
MAAPHAAGGAALFLELAPAAAPAEVAEAMRAGATAGVLKGLPSGSPDRLLYAPALGGEATPAPPTAAAPVTAPGSCAAASQLLLDAGFEDGAGRWVASEGVLDASVSPAPRSGRAKAWLAGYGAARADELWQQIAVPSDACSATLSLWLRITTSETAPAPVDVLTLSVRDAAGDLLATLGTWSNQTPLGSWTEVRLDLSALRGRTVRLHLRAVEDGARATSFLVDDVALEVVR